MTISLPFVSVVIPMRNEADSIAECLEAILGQDYPAERMEVLAVDGESEDGTQAVVAAIERRDPRLRLLDNPGRIVPTAMNIGIRAARGEIITRVDGHTTIAPDYVRIGVETLARTGADNVGGPMNAVGGGPFGDAVASATSSRFGIGSYFHFGTAEREVDTVYLGMWPRAVFERVGLFDEELVRNQDDELNYRIRKAGGRIVLTPEMRSWYQNRQSVRRLIRQYFQYGVWKIRVLQKHPRQMSWRHFVPPAFVAALLGLALAGAVVGIGGRLAAALAVIYAATVLAIAARLGLARGVRIWMTTALAFCLIHFAWGSGFLVGMARFGDRWRRPEPPPPSLVSGEKVAGIASSERSPQGDQEVLRRSV